MGIVLLKPKDLVEKTITLTLSVRTVKTTATLL